MPTRAAFAALAAVALLAACGKPPAPKVDAATEQAAARERAKKDVFGTQVQALDKAKQLEADVKASAGANVDAVEKDAK
jgi:hypothetical protein